MLICLVFQHNRIDLFRKFFASIIDGNVPNTIRKMLVAFDELMRGVNNDGRKPEDIFEGMPADDKNIYIEAVMKVASRRVGHDRLVLEIDPELYGRLNGYARVRGLTIARIIEAAITHAAVVHNVGK